MNGLLTIVRNRCIIGFRKNGTVQFRKGESVISQQGTKAAYHCLGAWTPDKRKVAQRLCNECVWRERKEH